MATPGQPTLYKPEYCELAHNYCLLGATNEVLGDFFGVTRRTIQNWIATHPDFAEAVRRGRAVADARVVRALFDRAWDFSHHLFRTTLYRGKEQTVTDMVLFAGHPCPRAVLLHRAKAAFFGRYGARKFDRSS